MDYTIIGSAVNLTASRLQSHSEIDGILLGHETYSLVRDDVAVEEQTPIKVKGFAEPVRCYKVLGLYDDLAEEGSVIREELDGFKVLLDLQKQDRAAAVAVWRRLSQGSKLQEAGPPERLTGTRSSYRARTGARGSPPTTACSRGSSAS